MLFKIIFNVIAICAIGTCIYYTSMFAKMNDDINELKTIIQNTCNPQNAHVKHKKGGKKNK